MPETKVNATQDISETSLAEPETIADNQGDGQEHAANSKTATGSGQTVDGDEQQTDGPKRDKAADITAAWKTVVSGNSNQT